MLVRSPRITGRDGETAKRPDGKGRRKRQDRKAARRQAKNVVLAALPSRRLAVSSLSRSEVRCYGQRAAPTVGQLDDRIGEDAQDQGGDDHAGDADVEQRGGGRAGN